MVCTLVLLSLAGPLPAPPRAEENILELVKAYQADTSASVGVYIVRLADGAPVIDVRAHTPLLPASNEKILTTAVALKRLGPGFQFKTSLVLSGNDLLIYGDGDPTIGDPRLTAARNQTVYSAFDRWAEVLQAKGIAKIDSLFVHAGIFQPPYTHPDWPANQGLRWYGAPVSGVNFNDNCLDFTFTVKGDKVVPNVVPASRLIVMDNKLKAGGKHLWNIAFNANGTAATLTGTVTTSTDPISVAVPDPTTLFACALAERLATAGIEIKTGVFTLTDTADAKGPDPKLRVLAVETTPLSDVLGRCNKNSLNMMAECLFLRSGVEKGEPSSWARAAEIAEKVLANDYGLDRAEFAVADGSGFSRKNQVSPFAIVSLLSTLVSQKVFVDSLAVAGVDGSLRERMDKIKGRVLGKTGSINGVSALSGYVLDKQGQPAIAFSILVNGKTAGARLTARGLEDAICEQLTTLSDTLPPTTTSAPAHRPGEH